MTATYIGENISFEKTCLRKFPNRKFVVLAQIGLQLAMLSNAVTTLQIPNCVRQHDHLDRLLYCGKPSQVEDTACLALFVVVLLLDQIQTTQTVSVKMK